ncbi:hypothetical protein CSV71_09615 [Sporosarcina sp. P21c]|uniref:DUF342 domain-containing protein n=1 Tax=unclassified Sporosarcina TaxID=2647733 RepID=UPI000C1650BE|nr:MULTISPECIES: FapA family protein [unclassified Sporosarcina]PIC66900.1 hypothetical protein CSV78_09920 [Sporosarcina sp. P16a]PIC89401.1 hypothetical protein CSV71_09615 [Sporosarcina sp. P21c]PIC92352.1 hypothetical protein CSV70_10665 [Sporosarcina sp. P25]
MLVENEYFELREENNKIIMNTKKVGYPLKSFDALASDIPRLKLNSFKELMKALQTEGQHDIGSYSAPCEVYISPSKMKVELYIHATNEEFLANKEQFLKQAEEMLDQREIRYDKESLLNLAYLPSNPIIIAVGKEPIQGESARVEYIAMPDRKPILRDDGSVDHYELNFVTPIVKDEWLGEKTPAQEGLEGYNIFGEPIAAKKGEDIKLVYDRKSVGEFEEDGKMVLRALHGGALEELNGAISVGKQLIIPDDVGTKTGSITFDGSVRVMGTVSAGFSVNATGDISIEGKEGITNAKEIYSEEGDVYIKGGVFGGGETIIKAKKNVFVKHANNCKIYGERVNIGLYSLGSELYGDHICIDKHKGRIIGGVAEAMFSIECATVGNSHERLTKLIVKGVNKELELEEIQRLAEKLKAEHAELKKIEQTLDKLKSVNASLPAGQLNMLEKTLLAKQQGIVSLDQTIKKKLQLVQVASAPTIEITREAHPGVHLVIGNKTSMLSRVTKGVFELTSEGVLNV